MLDLRQLTSIAIRPAAADFSLGPEPLQSDELTYGSGGPLANADRLFDPSLIA